MKFIKITPDSTIKHFRELLYAELNAPLDAMWELLHIALSSTYLIKQADTVIGYCCVDPEKSLNQIYLTPPHKYLMQEVLESLISSELILSAKLSSIEPIAFNTCLAMAKTIDINTFNYRHSDDQKQEIANIPLSLRPIRQEDLDTVKLYLKAEIDFDDQFGYVENLLERQEMYLIKEADELIATGECRLSDTQPQYADVGMIVKQSQRKKGLGAKVLSELAALAKTKGRIPICSTTADNIGSQKAITKAGFYHTSTIFDLRF